MSFLDIEFPRRIAMGAMRTAGWMTSVVETHGGWTSANQEWADVRHDYDVALAIRVAADYADVLTHFHQVRGRARTFPFRDFLDHQVKPADGVAVLVAGDEYQLCKQYGTDNPYTRKITRPVDGSVTVYRTRAAVQSVITPAITYTTGRIEVDDHEAGDTYQWAGQFMVPVRYSMDKLPGAVVDRRAGGGDLLVQCDGIMLLEDRE